MRLMGMVAAGVALLLGACAEGGGQPAGTERPAPQSETAAASPAAPAKGERELTGTFGGDAQLEGGCAWVDQGGKRWNVQYPQGYTLTLSPLRLTGPDGFVAEEGDTITVTGRERRDMMTTCQIGPVFEATSVAPGA